MASDPAPGARLDTAPGRLQLTFNEAVEAPLSEVTVLDARRQTLVRANPAEADAAAGRIAVDLPPLESGVYLVRWQARSRIDAHGEDGAFVFGVGADPAGSDLAGEAAREAPPSPDIFFRLFTRAGILLLTGSVILRWAIGPALAAVPAAAAAGLGVRIRRWAARSDGLALGLLLAGQAGLLAGQVLPRLDSGGPATAIAALGTTRLGLLGAGQLLVSLALTVAVFGWARGTRPGAAAADPPDQRVGPPDLVRLSLIAVLALLTSMTSHAAAGGEPLGVPANTLHLIAAAVWLGTIFHLAAGYLPAAARLPAPEQVRLLAGWLPRVSTVFIACVVVLVMTGPLLAWTGLGRPENLGGTLYGRTLLFKLLLFGGLLLAGAYNFWAIRRKVGASGHPSVQLTGRFAAALTLETILAVLILLEAGSLTDLPPPGLAPGVPAASAGSLGRHVSVTVERFDAG